LFALAAALPLSAQQRPAPVYYRMKQAVIVDEHGFERPMRALSVLVPTSWQFQGGVTFIPNSGCHADQVQIAFRSASPDNRYAVELFPGVHWTWSDDPSSVRMLQMAAQQSLRFGRRECDVQPPMAPGDYLRHIAIPKSRPNARVAEVEPMPEVSAKLRQKAQAEVSAAAQMGMHIRVGAEAARARIEYDVNGQPMEEWITAVTFASTTPGPSFNMATGQLGQTAYYNCGAYLVFGLRAPKGQLQKHESFFDLVLSTVHLDPGWEARVTQVILSMQASDSKGAMDRSAIITKSGHDISNMIREVHENHERALDRITVEFSQYLRGVETYRNPQTGEEVELSNMYGHAWSNALHEYVLSDSEFFNPNIALKGDWTQLVRAQR
jgi:hypothetical protein